MFRIYKQNKKVNVKCWYIITTGNKSQKDSLVNFVRKVNCTKINLIFFT